MLKINLWQKRDRKAGFIYWTLRGDMQFVYKKQNGRKD
jgi:hypothetical protein